MDITFLLVDGLNLIRRVYAAQPAEEGPDKAESALTAAVQSLERALRECRPTHAVCVFDSDERSWRHDVYPRYKEGREPMPGALRANLRLFEIAFEEHGVSCLRFPAIEADDIIATLAVKTARHDNRVVILSTDRMFMQLLSERIVLRDHFNKRTLDHEHVREKYGVTPEQFVDLIALTGDSTNAIPGVPSVGPKTAARLLNEIGPLEDILAVAHTVPGKTGEMLHAHAEDARISRELARLRTDLDLGVNLRVFRWDAGLKKDERTGGGVDSAREGTDTDGGEGRSE
ncbi:MAG: flap endonuclease Xni [Deltaproteobacteria bacterium]|nr:flap endonuclease Xni [Deltaproteobacteria bacterium]